MFLSHISLSARQRDAGALFLQRFLFLGRRRASRVFGSWVTFNDLLLLRVSLADADESGYLC